MLPAKRINGQNWLPDFFNDFIDGNICHEIRNKSYAERIEFFFSDYEEGKKLEKENKCGIIVFIS